MGDRCSVVIRIRKSDLNKANEISGGELEINKGTWSATEINNEDKKTIEFYLYEMNYGGDTLKTNLVDQNIPFVGSHSAGDEYGSYIFCSDGEKLSEQPTDHDGYLTCRVGDDGEPLTHDLKDIKDYLAAQERAMKILYQQ